MFSATSDIKFVCEQFIATSNVLTVKDENPKQCIFLILPVDVPLSYALTEVTVLVLQYC